MYQEMTAACPGAEVPGVCPRSPGRTWVHLGAPHAWEPCFPSSRSLWEITVLNQQRVIWEGWQDKVPLRAQKVAPGVPAKSLKWGEIPI